MWEMGREWERDGGDCMSVYDHASFKIVLMTYGSLASSQANE